MPDVKRLNAQHIRRVHGNSETGLALDMFLAKHFSNLTRMLSSACGAGYGGFSVTCKPDGKWFAVGRASSSDGDPIVAFGSGSNPYDALRELNSSIAAGKWKVDAFAQQRGLGPDKLAIQIASEHEGDISP